MIEFHLHGKYLTHILYPQYLAYHKTLMPIIWSLVINVLVILATFSSSKICMYIHAIGGTIVTAVTLYVTMMLSYGLSYEMHQPFSMTLHYYVGNICLVLNLLVIIFGLFLRLTNIFQFSQKVIDGMRFVHKISALILIIICKFQVYYNPEIHFMMPYFALQFLFIAIYIWLKFNKKLTLNSQPQKFNQPLRKIQSLKEIKDIENIGLISNKVYDLQPLKNWHPPGFQIINSVKGKQLDKYLLGIYSPEKLIDVKAHAHSPKIMNLLEQPIAQLAIPSNYTQIPPLTDVNLSKLLQISSNPKIYEMHLSSTQVPFQFINYRDIRELGRYHSLTLNNKITRLYTNVNFLQDQNIKFLKKYFKKSNNVQDYFEMRTKINNTIPLLFKHYPNGLFTNALVTEPINQLSLSQQLGLGFCLGQAPNGQILIIAGGTGIFPFADLIDLLFKQKLVKKNHKLKTEIQQLNPIIALGQLDRFRFKLFLSFRSIQEIHPIMLQQIIQISEIIQVKILFNIKNSLDKKLLGNVKIIDQFFDKDLKMSMQSDNLSRVIMCGPPAMRQELIKIMQSEQINDDLCLIL